MSLTQINKAGLDEIALDHVFTIGASGTDHYTFQGEGLNGTVNDPTLYLTRGKTYRFENGTGAHPIRIQSTSGASGTAYNTGVTNNAGSGTVIVEVQHDAPDVLYYQCTSHANMNGILYITGALADGGVTTAKLADDAVNNDKLANSVVASIAANTAKTSNATHTGDVTGSTSLTIASGAVTTAKIADGVVTEPKISSNAINTAKIVDGAITGPKISDATIGLDKLAHGTSSNDGKFLRANNGADPTFETVTGTTINNNADNRIITGSGTANTLEGEANLIYDGLRLGINRTPTTNADYPLQIKSANATAFAHFRSSQSAGDDPNTAGGLVGILNDDMYLWGRETGSRIIFGTNNAEQMRIVDNGEVGIGITNPETYGANGNGYAGLTVQAPTGSYSGITIRSGYNGAGSLQFADGNGSTAERRNGFIDCDHVNKRLNIGIEGSSKIRITENGFHPNPSDSAAANALDDYEEGTWSPTIHGTWYNNGTFRNTTYTKIGRLITVHFDLYQSSNNMGWGANASIRGFPYAAITGTLTTAALSTYSYQNSHAKHIPNYVDDYTNAQMVLHTHSQNQSIRHLLCSLTYMTT